MEWGEILEVGFREHGQLDRLRDGLRSGRPLGDAAFVDDLEAQPTLEVIRNLATALSVTSDQLLFGNDERGRVSEFLWLSPDEDLRLQCEAVSRFDEEEKRVVRSRLAGMILKHEARRSQTVTNGRERK